MKTKAIAWSVLVVAALALSGCCNSILCNVKKAAAGDLACNAEQLKIKNVTSEFDPGLSGDDRYLQVEGCGQQANYTCSPTNLKPTPKKRYREDKVVKQSRLDLKWKCESNSNIAKK